MRFVEELEENIKMGLYPEEGFAEALAQLLMSKVTFNLFQGGKNVCSCACLFSPILFFLVVPKKGEDFFVYCLV